MQGETKAARLHQHCFDLTLALREIPGFITPSVSGRS